MSTWSVPNSEKDKFNKKIRRYEREVDNYDNTCLFVTAGAGSRCRQPTVKCHSIPEASVLSQLQDLNGNVLDIGWGMIEWRNVLTGNTSVNLASSELFRPRRISISVASTAPFACNAHDQTFSVIDQANPNLSDWRVPLLMAYRIALFANDRWRKYGHFLYKQAEMLTKAHRNPYAQAELKRLMAQRNLLSPQMVQQVEGLGELWCKASASLSDMDVVSLPFKSNLKFAAALMIDSGTSYITISPRGNTTHVATIVYRRKDKRHVADYVKQLKTLSGLSRMTADSGVGFVTKLISDGFGSMVASPYSYESLTNEERDAIKISIHKLSRPEILEQMWSRRV